MRRGQKGVSALASHRSKHFPPCADPLCQVPIDIIKSQGESRARSESSVARHEGVSPRESTQGCQVKGCGGGTHRSFLKLPQMVSSRPCRAAITSRLGQGPGWRHLRARTSDPFSLLWDFGSWEAPGSEWRFSNRRGASCYHVMCVG